MQAGLGGRLYRWYADMGSDPRLAVAQAVNLQRQLPFLYALLIVNSLAIVLTHRTGLPLFSGTVVPVALLAFSSVRLVYWGLRARRTATPSPASARRQLRVVTMLGVLLAIAYVVWALTMLGHGSAAQRAHVMIYLTTTSIGCIFCLAALPQAALPVGLIVIPSFIGACLLRQDVMYSVIAINVALVLTVLLRVLFNGFDYFRQQVTSQTRLKRQHDELIRLNQENERLARTDTLTGLPNRRRFQDDLAELVDSGAAGPFAVGLLDLDRFKPVNDTFGHHVGDILLIQLADRMRALLHGGTCFYRLGGDEFGLLVSGDARMAGAVGARLCQALEEPFVIGELTLAVGGSLGIAMFPDAGHAATELFDRADYALYHAKRVQGGGMCVFTHDLESAIRRDRAIEAALQACVFDDELRLYGQPIVAPRTGRVEAIELLARWHSPLLGEVAPTDFITVAERSTLIHGITLSVFRKGLAIAPLLPDEVALSFNISACDLHSPATFAAIEHDLLASGIAPSRIWFEVTETAVMRDPAAAARMLERLRRMGMKIALDDFGTGHSSLSNLHQLPLDKVKIDRSFINDLQAQRGWAVVEAVVGLCRALSLECVAEGVQSAEQLETLLRMGCEHVQGFLFAEPLPVEQLPETIRIIGRHAA
ncbi:diguanylate cyclase (GGDEF)-like protein [Sphingomonas sp. BE138]|uniref:putative bifunctional diguanylate cyclase/phosphodiesterase n=1 Tax=Sphingomonas sp. BE138 TaxID=2817845 RepID=UPI00285A08CF|nr:EAL domain-containing protein [Sphingomonas sp. BE138]MDR6789821.1 diguanylate cyclase (GGDEF)-like protein [Sphingomonas sp. BE138]